MAYCLYPNCPDQAETGEDYCREHRLGGKPIVYSRTPTRSNDDEVRDKPSDGPSRSDYKILS